MSFAFISAKSLRQVCQLMFLSAFIWCSAYSQQAQVQSMDWTKKFAAETSAKALQKVSGKLRQLPYAPREFVQMQAQVIEIKNLESGDPVAGLLVKSSGGREELEALGGQVTAQVGDIFALQLPLSRLSALANLSSVRKIEPAMLRKPKLDKSILDVKANLVHQGNYATTPPSYAGFTGQNVLVGIVDTGIDWRHGDFIKDGTTTSRILYIWDQNLVPASTEKSPAGFAYGVEYTQQDVNNEIDGTPANFVRSFDTNGHGTHVAGIAAGDGSATGGGRPAYTYVGMAPRADLVAISTNFFDSGILGAVEYMMKKSDELGKPAVLNMSLGGQFGPHDGTELISQGIDAAINTGKVHVVIAAGNEGTDAAHGEYIHAEGTVAAGASVTHEFVVPTYTANSGTGNDVIFFNIWYQGNDRLTIQVITPGGLSWSAASGSNNNGTFSNTSDGAIYIDNASAGSDPENGDRLGLIQIFDNSSTAPPRAGTWKIVVTGATVAESGHFDNWLYVSQLGSTSAYFSAASGNLEELVAIPGVTNRAITVAAYSTKTSWTDYLNRAQTAAGAVLNDLAYFSSPGPSRDDPGFITGRQKPEISAPGFGVVSSFSANATGFSSSIYRNQDQVHLMLWGTSMATPQIVGAVALLLEKNPKLTAAQVKSALMNTARKDAFTGGATNFRWGAGKLDIQAAANTVTQPSHAFDLFPSSFSRYALPNTAAEYIATIRNQGALADSYTLSASGNLWPTTFFNAAGTTPITNTGTVQPGATVQFRIRVAVPNGTPANQQDRATVRAISTGNAGISDAATVVTRTPGAIPFVEMFATATLDTVRWVLNSGPAKADTAGIAEPSPPYSLNLDGEESGGDEIHTQALNLAGMSGVQLEYLYQRTGRGNSPETGEDLWVDYLNATGQWVNLRQYLGSGPDMTAFEKEIIALPANAHHAFFQLRFRNLATAGPFDDWFVDDIKLTPPPDITITPSSFAVTVNWGDSTAQTLQIGNVGQGDLAYSISISAATSLLANLASSKIDEARRADYLNKIPRQASEFVAKPRVEDPKYSDGIAPMAEEQNQLFEPAGLAKRTLAPARVYWDYYHAREHTLVTAVISELRNAGHTVTEFSVPITAAALTGFDIVVIETPGSNNIGLSSAEIAAVQSFVNSGRGLFVMGEAESYLGTIGASSINSLLSPYGMSISGSFNAGINTPVTDFTAHPVTQNVRTAEFTYFCDIAINAPSTRLARTSAGINVLAAHQAVGKIVLAADSHPFDSRYLYLLDDLVLSLNIIDWLSAGAGVPWLKASPTSGKVTPTATGNVKLSFNSRPVIPGRTYRANVNISSNDPDESPLVVPAQMIVNPEPYFVVVNPPDSKANGLGKDVVAHALRIFNYGQNSDSYTLQLAGNKWKTQAFDSTGKTLLTKTPVVAAGGNIKILVQVTVDSLARGGTQDTVRVAAISAGNATRVASAKLTTITRGLRGTIPFVEKFPAATLDPVKWPVNNGPAVVDTLGTREPSAPYSLDFNGTDEVQSQVFDLSGAKNLVMRYFYEMGGGGDIAETGNDLILEYFNSAGNWRTLQRHLGGGIKMTAYVLQQFTLPDSAYHKNFALRFRTTGDAGSDNWFVDDVSINLPPVISLAPNLFEVTLAQGDSVKQILTIENRGVSDLNYSISIQPGSTTLQQTMSGAGFVEAIAQGYSPDQAHASRAGNIGPLTPSQGENQPANTVLAPAQTASASSAAALRILSWTGYVDLLREYPNTFAALRQFFTDFTLTETSTTTPAVLQTLLNAADVFLIAEQETSLDLTSLGASWAAILNAFVARGGSVIVLEHGSGTVRGSSTLLNGTGLMSLTLQTTFTSSVSVRVLNASHPIAAGLPNTFLVMNGNNSHVSNGVKIIENVSNSGAVVSARTIGSGHVVYMGMDFYEYNSDMARLLANTVQWKGGGVDWLTLLSPSTGAVAPGAKQNVDFKFSATRLPADTTVKAIIAVSSNDPSNSTINIPATLHVQQQCLQPTHFKFRANTGSSYALVVDDATLDGARLSRCDEIGVFTRAGLCVGAVAWNDTLPLGFAAWEDDPQTPAVDGYRPGEKMYFLIWDASAKKEYDGIPAYKIGDGNFGSGALARFTLGSSSEVAQTVSLRQGWNWFSVHVGPTKPHMDSVFAKVAGLEIVQNCAGKFYIPGVINQLGNFNALESYIAYLSRASSVTVRGQQLPSNTPIVLPAGWSCIPYLPQNPLPPQTALQSILATLNIVKDDSGHFFIPGLVDNIKQMRPGRGYKANLARPDTLIYPPFSAVLSKLATGLPGASPAPVHFKPVPITRESYSLVVASVQIDGHSAQPGDEIAVLTSANRVVGAGVWNENGILALAAWRDDEQTPEVDGYQPGEAISFRLWDHSANTELVLIPAFEKGDGAFGNGPYALVKLAAKAVPTAFALHKAYPNPFNPETTIEYDLPVEARVTIKIYDVVGREVRTLVDELKPAGYHQIVWDARNGQGHAVASGVYLYRLQTKGFARTERLMFLK
jgi:subtilisin family serine protease